MKKDIFLRIVFYAAGLLILALGIILNTKSGLGVSPIISVAYSIATIGGFNFGNITFLIPKFIASMHIGNTPFILFIFPFSDSSPINIVFSNFLFIISFCANSIPIAIGRS